MSGPPSSNRRLTGVTNTKGAATLSGFAMTLDPAGNPTTIVRSGSTSETATYTYDNLDRVTGVCSQTSCPGPADPFVRWTYDDVGNRLSEARPTGTTNYVYNSADQLTQAGSTTYTYDGNGNLKSAGPITFSYDLANRLSSTTSGSTTTTYTYDGLGKRLQASSGSQAAKKTNYLWDINAGLPQIALERNGNDQLTRRYLYGAARISMTTGTSAHYYHRDPLGSTVNVTASTGAPQWTYSYEPYGRIRNETKNHNQAPDNPIKFAGEYLDPTGLYHFRARQYDPATGRFITTDPKPRDPLDAYMSSYVYAEDQPTVLIDPSGLGAIGSTCGSIGCWLNQEVAPYASACATGAAQGFAVSWWTGQGALAGTAGGCGQEVVERLVSKHVGGNAASVVNFVGNVRDLKRVARATEIDLELDAVFVRCGRVGLIGATGSCRVSGRGGAVSLGINRSGAIYGGLP